MKVKRLRLILLLIVAFTSMVAFAACKDKPKDQDTPETPGEEAGNYYFDASNGMEYTVSLDGYDLYTYSFGTSTGFGDYTKEDGVMTFYPARDAETVIFTAELSDDMLVVTYNGGEMRFYKKVFYTVSFSAEGGSMLDPVSVLNGSTMEKPADPVRSGYTFLGWYTDSEYQDPFLFDAQPVTGDLTLYAYWSKDAIGQGEFTISFDLNYDGADAPDDVQTVGGGKLYSLPAEPVREGYTFNGWWISMYEGEAENPAERLSYPYTDGMTFRQNTTLYALWTAVPTGSKLSAPIVSVEGDTVRWNASQGVSGYSVKVTGPEGFDSIEQNPGSATLAVPFSTSPAGDYVISVRANSTNPDNNSDTTTIYYKNKALDAVSQFTIAAPSVLVFNAVDHADRYYLTVDCGDDAHCHTMVDLGSSTSYNFSNCPMQEGGIRFTVTAVGEGYASAVSKTFVYNRALAGIEEFRFDEATETLYWDAVPDAAGYVVSVVAGNGTYRYEIGAKTNFCLKNFAAGDEGVVVSVYPRTKGYNAPEAKEYIYNKTRLAAPSQIRMDGTVLMWTDCGAVSYQVSIGSRVFPATTNSFDLSSVSNAIEWVASEIYQVSVRALGASEAENSLWSDAEDVCYQDMADSLSYEAGVVSWDHVIGADSYEVRVNGGEAVSVDGGLNYAKISLTQAGYNTVEVRYLKEGVVSSEWKKLEVYAYAVTFDTNGGSAVATQFKAYGDPYDEIDAPELEGYDFDAWYTTPGGPATNGARYEDETFTESGELVLYAHYVAKTYTVTLELQGGGTLETNTAEVVFNSMYQWPIPTVASNSGWVFKGWFSQPKGNGVRYTDNKGASILPWTEAGEGIVAYAAWEDDVFTFEETTVGEGSSMTRGYAVSAGGEAATVSEITIPSEYKGLPVVSISQKAFSGLSNLKVVNIPDSILSINYSRDGAFLNCSNLTAINFYESNIAQKGEYYSEDGVLFLKHVNQDSGDESSTVSLLMYPVNKAGDAYRVPDGVNIIVEDAFMESKVKEVTIPASVASIGANAFMSCPNLVSVVIEDPADGEEVVTLTIAQRAFGSSKQLERVELPARLTGISLTKYSLGNATSSGGAPSSQSISTNSTSAGIVDAFAGCTKLAEIVIADGNPVYSSDGGVIMMTTEESGKDITTIVYASANFAGENGVYTVPAGVTRIANGAFVKCSKLTEVIISNTVESIGEVAFYGCTGLKKVTFKGNGFVENVTIGKYAFRGNAALESVVFEDACHVTEIGEGAFFDCTGLESFTIPASMKTVGVQAFRASGLREVSFADGGGDLTFGTDVFYNCINLTTFNLPANVTQLPSVFSGCVSLQYVNVDKGNQNYTSVDGVVYSKDISTLLFFPQARGGEIVLPDELVKISEGVFAGNSALTKITIGANVQEIGARAFRDCTNLQTIVFTEGGKQLAIGEYAFDGCVLVRTLKLPAHTKSIGANAFSEMSLLQSVTLNEGLESIGTQAFYWDTSLNNVEIPSTVTSLGEFVFRWAKSLKNVSFAEGSAITEIGKNAFAESYITSITIPKSVKTIGEGAFANNEALQYVYFEENGVLEKIGIEAFAYTALISIEIPKTVTAIAPYAFSSCGSLTTLTFEDGGAADLTIGALDESKASTGVTQPLYGYTFSYCYKLKEIHFPARLTEIGQNAFRQCSALTTISFGGEGHGGESRLKNIGAYAFTQCAALAGEIRLPKTMCNLSVISAANDTQSAHVDYERTAIGAGAFSGCYAITAVIFEDGGSSEDEVTIGSGAFENCRNLVTLHLPNRLAEYVIDAKNKLDPLPKSAFSGCIELLPEGVTMESGDAVIVIKDGIVYNNDMTELKYAFSTVSGIVTVPGTVETIAASAFANCSEITEIEFEEGSALTTIEKNAFSNCSSLTEIVIPAGVESLGDYAFSNCSALTTITLPGTLKLGEEGKDEFDLSIFSGCGKLTNIIFDNHPTYESVDGVVFTDEGKTLVYYPTTRADESYTVSAGVTAIAPQAFAGNTKLKNVVLPSGLVTIGNNAFNGCTALVSINIPNTVTLIDDGAFNGCVSLSELTFEAGNDKVGLFIGSGDHPTGTMNNTNAEVDMRFAYTDVFADTYSLTHIDFPTRLVKIEDRAFWNSGLQSMTFGASSLLTEIGDYAFRASDLKSVALPEGLTTIGNLAFYECVSLESVSLPASLTTMKRYAFAECEKLSSVTFAAGCKLAALSNGVFALCTSLKSIQLPAGIETIADSDNTGLSQTFPSDIKVSSTVSNVDTRPFYGCADLSSITFEAGSKLKTIGKYGLAHLDGLTTLSLPEGVETIGERAIEGNDLFTQFTIPGTVTEIGDYAFYNMKGLTKIVIPASVKTLGTYVFNGCSELVTVELAQGYNITAFPNYFFYNCSKLENVIVTGDTMTPGKVVIPSNITTLGSNVFYGCKALTSVTIPNTVTSIGANLFQNCTALTELDLSALSANITELPASFVRGCTKLTALAIPAHITSFGTYCFAQTGFVAFTIPSGVTALPNYLFQNCSSLKEVVFHSQVTTLGSYVFSGCKALTSMIIPDTVTSIGTYLFQNCTSLISAALPANGSITAIPNYMFSGCTSLTNVTIPDTITSIGAVATSTATVNVFQNCTSLEAFEIPASITYIGPSAFTGSGLKSIVVPATVLQLRTKAFMNCKSLESVTIEGGTALEDSLFSGCTSLKEVQLPTTLASVGASVFQGTTALTQIGLPGGVGSIGKSAFSGSGLTSFTAPASLASLGENVFEDCASLKEVALGNVVDIGAEAFVGCTALETVVFGDTVSIGDNAFDGCSALTAVNLPETLTSIGESAFANTSLTEITVPGLVREIGATAFENCRSLTTATLLGVSVIGDYAFAGCENLESVELSAELVELGANVFDGCTKLVYSVAEGGAFRMVDGVLYKGENEIWAYPTSKTGDYTVPENVIVRAYAFANATIGALTLSDGVVLEEYAFVNATIESVDLGDTLTAIPDYAFNGVASLASVEIPNTVTSIGESAFENIKTLKTLVFAAGGEAALTLGESAFAGTSITGELTIPSRVRIPVASKSTEFPIGASCFQNCTLITSVVCEETDSVTGAFRIGSDAFAGCTSLATVVLPKALSGVSASTSGDGLAASVFEGCSKLQTVQVHDSLEEGNVAYKLGSSVFADCTLFEGFIIVGEDGTIPTEVSGELPSCVNGIGAYTFENSGIVRMTLHENITGSVGTSVFVGCAKLEEVVLAAPNMKQIYSNFFKDCVSLKRVEIRAEAIATIAANAFTNCVSMESFVIPAQITKVNANAFVGWTAEQTIYIEGGIAQAGGFASGWNNDCEAHIVYGLPEEDTQE